MKRLGLFIITIQFCLVLFTASLAKSEELTRYSFGVVPQFEQRKLFRIWRPILDELEQRTGFVFELSGSPKIPVFEQNFLSGYYDFVYLNPYHQIMAHDAQDYLPLIRDGEQQLKGILVVSDKSQINQVQELDGKTVAFPSPNALGASLLMRAELAKLHSVRVIPNYVQTHSSVYLHVALGINPAGGGVMSTLQEQKPEIKEKLRIIYETRSINPHPISAHPRIPEKDREKVRQALLQMAETKKGTALLAKIPMSKVVVAVMDDYNPMLYLGLDEFYVSTRQEKRSDLHQQQGIYKGD